jgi:hypothetical protein
LFFKLLAGIVDKPTGWVGDSNLTARRTVPCPSPCRRREKKVPPPGVRRLYNHKMILRPVYNAGKRGFLEEFI